MNENETLEEYPDTPIEKLTPLNLQSNKGLQGKFVQLLGWGEWCLCHYEYGTEHLISCLGLGKPSGFPIDIKEVCQVKEADSYLSKVLPSNQVTIWKDELNRLFVVIPSEHKNIFSKQRIDFNIKDGALKPTYSDPISLGYTYQIDGLTLIATSDILSKEYSSKLRPSIKFTVEVMVNDPTFVNKLSDNLVEDLIVDEPEFANEDIVFSEPTIKKLVNL